MVVDQTRELLEKVGQEHLLQFWGDLSAEEQTDLSSQIDRIDLEAINTYYQ